jgi:hypothetical protein
MYYDIDYTMFPIPFPSFIYAHTDTVDKKENGVKKFDSYKPHREDTNSGAVIMEDDGESDGNDSSEPVELERQEQDDKPDAVSSDSNHTSVAMSPSLADDVRDNMQ